MKSIQNNYGQPNLEFVQGETVYKVDFPNRQIYRRNLTPIVHAYVAFIATIISSIMSHNFFYGNSTRIDRFRPQMHTIL